MSRRDETSVPAVDLAALCLHLEHESPVSTRADGTAPKVYAALMAQLRDAGATGVSSTEFDALTAGFGRTHLAALRVALTALEHAEMRPAFRVALAERGTRDVVARALVQSVRDLEDGVAAVRAATHALTRLYRAIERATDGRAEREWLARMLIARLGATVAGETEVQSRAALAQRDYARLHAVAAVARSESKQSRWAKLAAQQADEDVRLPPRGKW